MDIQRKAFESSNNVNPDWSFKFDEELQQYVATDFEMTNQVDEFNEHWDTFRAGWEAKVQAVPEWISVEDRLPKENQFCVTYFEPTKSRIGALAGHYEFGFGLSSFGYRKATHWMPLPDAPQEPAND